MLKTPQKHQQNDDKQVCKLGSDVKGHRGKQHIFTSQLNSWTTVRIIFLHLSPNKFSSACNLLCRIPSVSCVTFLTAHYKHWNWFGVVSSLPLKWWKCKRHITHCSSALQEAGKCRWIYCFLLLVLIWYYSWLFFKILLLSLFRILDTLDLITFY